MQSASELVGSFLQTNPSFFFDVAEFIESTRFSDPVLAEFRDFCRAFYSADHGGDPWRDRRATFFDLVRAIPGYRTIDWARDDYWNSIPLISKDTLRERGKDFVNDKVDPESVWIRPTSGTTGPPVDIHLAQKSHFDMQLFSTCRIAFIAGALGDEVLSRPVFCLSLDDNKGIPDRVWADAGGFRGLTVRATFDERETLSRETLRDLLERHDPAILSIKPNVLQSVLERAGDFRPRTGEGITLVICSGAPLSEGLQASAQSILGVPVINAYGLSEFGVVASECRHQCGLHLHDHHLIAEILGPDGNIVPEGRGELVLSCTAHDAMPFLRFRTGDLVELSSSACACGKTGKVLTRIEGRTAPTFKLSDGTEFYPTNLKTLLKSFPLREFRVTQLEIDQVHAEVEFRPDCTDRGAYLEQIDARITQAIGPQVRVTVREVQFDPAEDFQRYRTCVSAPDLH